MQSAVADLAPSRVDELAGAAAQAAVARGVVGIVDFEQPDCAPVWRRRIAAGDRSLRVVCSVWPQRLDVALRRGARSGDPVAGTDGLATVGPLKVIIDGSLNTRTAYCFDPYPGIEGADANGLLTVGADELAQLLRRAPPRRSGRRGPRDRRPRDRRRPDRVRADARRPRPTRHHRARPAHRSRRRRPDGRLGLTASVQPEHAVDDRDVADRYWAGRTGRAFAYRTLLDAGVSLALGSDAPVGATGSVGGDGRRRRPHPRSARTLAPRATHHGRRSAAGQRAGTSRGRRRGRPGHRRPRSAHGHRRPITDDAGGGHGCSAAR